MHLTNDQKTEVDALFAYYNKQGVPELDYSNGLTSRNLRGLDLAMEKDAKQQLLFNNNSNRQFSENDEFITYVAFLIDIAAEVVRDNKRLQQLGVMRTSYSNIYDYMNIYLRHKNHPLFYKNDEEAETRLTAAQKVYRSMEISLARMTEMIGAVNYAIERSTLVRMQLPEVASLFDSGGLPTLNHFYDSGLTNRLTLIKDGLEQIQNDFVKEYKERVAVVTDAELLRIVKIQFDSDFIKLQKALDDVNLVYEIAKSNTDLLKNELKNATMSDALFMIQKTTLPLLKDLARNNPESYQSIIISLDESQRLIYLHLKTTYPFLNNLTDDSDAFIDLIKSLYEFDRSSTFSDYRNLLTQLDNLFEGGDIKQALSTINTFVKDYVQIKELDGKEVIEFNVESFLARLQSIQSDKIQRLQFLFTVGKNTAFLNKDLTLANGDVMRNFTHVSEKIGFSFKIKSWGDWMPRSPGESYGSFGYRYTKKTAPVEPLVSNIHIIGYGSGILYNVVNTTNNKEFNFPMAGTGVGMTFYNALDVNLTAAVPVFSNGTMKKSFTYPMYGLSFDIQFVEYLEALNRKREANQTQKRLAEAASVSNN